MISAVVAYSRNRVIGRDNDLPWYLPEDLKHFKDMTTGKTVIMGRKTYESIVSRLGKPLPNRRNIVISRTIKLNGGGAEIAHDLAEAVKLAAYDSEAVIIGGQQVFEQALAEDIIDMIYATEVDLEIQGDKHFPPLKNSHWRETARRPSSDGSYNYDFVTYERIRP